MARRSALARSCIGLVAGVLAGLFGVGGGILFVPTLDLVLGLGSSTREATSLLAILPMSRSGTWRQHRYGNVRWRPAVVIGVAAIAGVEAGGLLAKSSRSGAAPAVRRPVAGRGRAARLARAPRARRPGSRTSCENPWRRGSPGRSRARASPLSPLSGAFCPRPPLERPGDRRAHRVQIAVPGPGARGLGRPRRPTRSAPAARSPTRRTARSSTPGPSHGRLPNPARRRRPRRGRLDGLASSGARSRPRSSAPRPASANGQGSAADSPGSTVTGSSSRPGGDGRAAPRSSSATGARDLLEQGLRSLDTKPRPARARS